MSARGRCDSRCGGDVLSLAVDVLGLGEEEVPARETGLRWKVVLMAAERDLQPVSREAKAGNREC